MIAKRSADLLMTGNNTKIGENFFYSKHELANIIEQNFSNPSLAKNFDLYSIYVIYMNICLGCELYKKDKIDELNILLNKIGQLSNSFIKIFEKCTDPVLKSCMWPVVNILASLSTLNALHDMFSIVETE